MGGRTRVITADGGDAGMRLDLVLRRHLADIHAASRARIQRWIGDGHVRVNGLAVTRPAARPAFGDAIAVLMPDLAEPVPMTGAPLALDVVYEDAHLLVVNKPPGLVAHPTYRHGDGTLMNGLLWLAREWPDGRPSLVSRLDKLTSGLVLVARSAAAHAALQRAMGRADAEKDYLAVVYGDPGAGATDLIDAPLGRDPADRRRVVVRPDGAPSTTRVERLAGRDLGGTAVALLRCRLLTGRTHQIRVHVAARGWPIVGDPVYGESRWTAVGDPALGARLRDFPRQALHAWRLRLLHPLTGETLHLEAPPPADLASLLEALDLTWTPRAAHGVDQAVAAVGPLYLG